MLPLSREKIKPNFIGIGGQKCASTWVSEVLRYHPNVYMSNPKEIQFFSTRWNNGLDWYLEHFQNADRKKKLAIGEFSVNYMTPISAERIYSVLGTVKILVVLRNPVSRFLSHYKHYIREGKLLKNKYFVLNLDTLCSALDEYPELLQNGYYSISLKHYMNIFGNENIHIILNEDIQKNPQQVVKGIYTFLGVDPMFQSPIINKKVSLGIIPRFEFLESLRLFAYGILYHRAPKMIALTRKLRIAEAYRKINTRDEKGGLKIQKDALEQLFLYYEEEITKTEALIRRNLTHWRSIN